MKKVLLFVYVVVGMFLSNNTLAAVATVQALDFGEWVVKLNDAEYDITINTDSSYSFDSVAFVEITAPQKGIYDFTGLTPNASITVTVTQNSPLTAFGPDFEMVSLQKLHASTTDPAGAVTITVGGTARTSGSSGPYSDETFNGELQILIEF